MPLKTALLALLVVVIWGSNFSVVRSAVTEMPPLAFMSFRFFLAGFLAAFFVDWAEFRKYWKALLSVGILMGVLHQGTMFPALAISEAGLMSILLQSQVIMVTLLGWLFLKETIGWRTGSGIALGFIGVMVLIIPGLQGSTPPLAYALGIISALFVAMAYIKMKSLPAISPANFIFGINVVAPIVLLMSFFFEGTGWVAQLPSFNWHIIAPALAFQVFALSFSHALWQRLLANNPMSLIVPWCLLIPVFGVLAGILFLGEALTLPIVIGGITTILGVGIITFRKIQKNDPIEMESFD